MSDYSERSQTIDFIAENFVKIVDENGEFFGSGFFIEVNQEIYCITCHHCIHSLDKIFVERCNNKYQSEWVEQYSDMRKDLAILKVENCPLKPLLFSKEAMGQLPVIIRGFSGEKLNDFPDGTDEDSSLSDTIRAFEGLGIEMSGAKKWNRKPAVRVYVFKCKGSFDLGLSGAPVCYKGTYKVVGIFTAKDDTAGYVIPIQTLLGIFETEMSLSKQHNQFEQQSINNIQKLLRDGNKLLSEMKYCEAISIYDKIIFDPSYLDAIFNKAHALKELSQYKESIEWCNKGLAIDPTNIDALYDKSESLGSLGKYEEAIIECNKVLSIDANHVDALYAKAVYLTSLAKYGEAVKEYEKIIIINPAHMNAIKNQDIIRSRISKSKL